MLCFDWLIRLIPSNVQFVGAGCMHRFFRGAVKICQVSKCPKGECQNSDVSWHQCSLSLFVCLCAFERPICYTFSWDWSMDRNETPARDSNHGIPCGEKCWFLAWKRLWPNSGAFELGHQFQELTSLIFSGGPNDGIFYGSFQKWLVHISSLHRSSSRFRSISGGYDWAGAADALRPLGEAGRDGDGAPISTSTKYVS